MYASVRGLYGETSQRTLAIVKLLLCNGANIAARDDMVRYKLNAPAITQQLEDVKSAYKRDCFSCLCSYNPCNAAIVHLTLVWVQLHARLSFVMLRCSYC